MYAVAAAASGLQYCSVGSLMADVRQCCFPPGEEEKGGRGGGKLYLVSGCGSTGFVPGFVVKVTPERLV